MSDDEGMDPFDPENRGIFMLIALMRLYDVGMAILMNMDEETAIKLNEIHENGELIGSFPWMDMTK